MQKYTSLLYLWQYVVWISLVKIRHLNLLGDEISTKRPIDEVTDKTEQVEEDANEEKAKSPQKKVLKRRNLAIYATNDDETE